MALTSVGYTGSVSDVEDAIRSKFQGANYPVVADAGDFAVTINNVSSRTVDIAPGVAWAHGVQVTNSATATVSLDTVATSGQTRWDAIVLRRTWGTAAVALTKVNGTAALDAPLVVPTLNDSPGDVHDQLLALAQVTNGQLLVTSIDPRRGWASKTFTFPTLASLPPAASVPYGTVATLLNGTDYRRLLDVGASPGWVAGSFGGQAEVTGAAAFTAATGWTTTGLSNRALTIAATGDVQLNLQVRRTGATMLADTVHGNFSPDVVVGTAGSGLTPTNQTIPCAVEYLGEANFVAFPGWARLETDGRLVLQSGMPGIDLLARAGGTDISLRACLRFSRKVI